KRASELKTAVSNFNEFKFKALNLQTDLNVFKPDESVVYTKKFKNAGQAKIYLNSLASTTQIFRNYTGSEYQVFIISEPNFNKMSADKSVQNYMLFHQQYYK